MTLDMRLLQRTADWLAVAVVVSLPWSTSASIILIVLWLLAVLPTLAVADMRRELLTAAGGLPVLLWLLAAVGMLWADVPWAERIDGLGGFHRLLAIPVAAGAIPPLAMWALRLLWLSHFGDRDVGAIVAPCSASVTGASITYRFLVRTPKRMACRSRTISWTAASS